MYIDGSAAQTHEQSPRHASDAHHVTSTAAERYRNMQLLQLWRVVVPLFYKHRQEPSDGLNGYCAVSGGTGGG